ncbi:MAG: glycoside hydrolase family 127 protein [Lachnospiraceae bacterium]|nr:glycoside hydrolase family 127 protein [Lachnospiraceae bacterium]
MNPGTTINDTFFRRYRELVRKEMIPFQWNVLNDAIDVNIERERNDASIPNEKSHAIANFRIAAGLEKGQHYGWVFQDSDVYKWLEAVAYSLQSTPDDDLKALADGVVDLIEEAQEDDGYLNTYFSITEPEGKYKRLGESHELYCAGHFIEAAVAYHEATNNEKVLNTAKKLADHICNTFGKEEGKICGVDGHEEIEIGLMRLFHLTGEVRYLKEAEFFLRERGQDPEFFDKQWKDGGKMLMGGLASLPKSYFQVHLPVEKQETAEGHAVRLVYMCTALADLAATIKDERLADACRRIWNNIVKRRMYITGGIGSTVLGESFTLDYDLPNDTMYCETCASIGLMFFARQMLRIESKGEYADIMEKALYNTALSGMALDGKHFFYVNPLEVDPKKSKLDPTKSHVKPVRPQWLGCACCPPNLARMITSLDRYIYTEKEDEILVNLFISSDAEFKNGEVTISQETEYPKTGETVIKVNNNGADLIRIGVRLPSWSGKNRLSPDGREYESGSPNGYCYFDINKGEHLIRLEMDMEPKRWYTNPKVSENMGKVAISRGPQVYCMEEADNGEDLHCLYLLRDAKLSYEWKEDLLNGVGFISADGIRYETDEKSGLYFYGKKAEYKKQTIKMIPYYAWANRGKNEMRVWINEKE